MDGSRIYASSRLVEETNRTKEIFDELHPQVTNFKVSLCCLEHFGTHL